DCLNWIYQRMLLYETAREAHFDVIVTHDAEDVIHPESMLWINWHMRDHDMVQIPVLPLPTPLTLWTHGIYIDEFSEYQCRDMPARQFMGAFVPSNGVGTGFRREALDELAASQGNRIFEPVCLTEDYENGLRLKLRGAKQLFLQIRDHSVATREYFPQTFATAVKQRTRWVTGISLQTWERYGWSGKLVDKYWLWRDRKGLIGNPASLLTNILFAWGAVCGAMENFAGWHSQFYARTLELAPLFAVTSVVGVYRMLFRGYAVGRRFGWKFAIGVPVRVVVANCINAQATIRAFARYASARLKGEPLVWVKTEHQYPTAASLIRERRLIGEILVMNGYIEEFQLRAALLSKPPDRRLGEHLIDLGTLNEDDLYEALSLQHHLPNTRVEPSDVRLGVARSLPAHVARLWGVVPFGVEDGKLLLAGAELPSPGLEPALKHFTRLEIRFYLMSSSRLHVLAETLL
ncbi:MAG: glycosyltransferase, partial [Bryobacteraceae bacterium]|nr:glycosyltransferase [Bryobacteraceae bacterium]